MTKTIIRTAISSGKSKAFNYKIFRLIIAAMSILFIISCSDNNDVVFLEDKLENIFKAAKNGNKMCISVNVANPFRYKLSS